MLLESEQETIVKRVLPYLRRRGYSDIDDLAFETSMKLSTRYSMGYADILVKCGKAAPSFVIEVKRTSKNLNASDVKQAVEYGRSLKTLFVAVTNGRVVRCYNTTNSEPILWDGRLSDKLPSKSQLPKVVAALKANRQATTLSLADDVSPFRPALPLKQLNALFKRCHNAIRKIEKNEENAFADFSKLLFLKLLEEKEDAALFKLPYTYRFYELAEKPDYEADQVKTAILDMLEKVKSDFNYGDVLGDRVKLKSPKTFHYIVKALGNVYFADSNLDAKGAAFEYFVRATLKGKKLGQYFTPRPLIEFMSSLCGGTKIINALLSGVDMKVLDPSCGTGGFLVFLLNQALEQAASSLQSNTINLATYNKIVMLLKAKTFYGADANHGVACSAKMNMIVAGDGHTNILPEDSLASTSQSWDAQVPSCDLILTNPPFGTSERESLTSADLALFPIRSSKGQNLFLQKMVLATKPGGEICTVIDEGLLNTDSGAAVRRWLLQECRLLAIVRLPDETFKPNKINVRSSVLYMRRSDQPDVDLVNNYLVTFIDVLNLGYDSSGDSVRGFNAKAFLAEIGTQSLDRGLGPTRSGYGWRAFDLPSSDLTADSRHRLDWKYWEPEVRQRIQELRAAGGRSISELNTIPTKRGKSPSADLYVDRTDGYAAVLKAGTSVNRFGQVHAGSDFVQEDVYAQMPLRALVQTGDVLLSSTGDGTLSKCGVYVDTEPAIADGHVTIIRPDPDLVDAQYLADYLRAGFGASQINRLYTGATGLIELPEVRIDEIVIDTLKGNLEEQRLKSKILRDAEEKFRQESEQSRSALDSAFALFQ